MLARSANAPVNIVELCAKITPAYTAARYPDTPAKYSKADSEELLKYATEVLQWVTKRLG